MAYSTGSDDLDNGLEFVRRTRTVGRKRVVFSDFAEPSDLSCPFSTPLRKRQGRKTKMQKLNRLESLPQDVLVSLLSKVYHSDLKHLLLVSKLVNQTALIARDVHFAFSTPPPTKRVFRSNWVLPGEESEEAPGAPMQHRIPRARLDPAKVDSLAVALFADLEEEWSEEDVA